MEESKNRSTRRRRIQESYVNRKSVKLFDINGRLLITTGAQVGDTFLYSGLYTMKVTKVENVIAADGKKYEGVPCELEYTRPSGKKVKKTTNGKTWARIRIQRSGTTNIGDDYEIMAAKATGGAKRGKAGYPDVENIPLVGGGKVNAEVGGFGKVSQMGNVKNGLTTKVAMSGKKKNPNKELHHARRAALGYANAVKTQNNLGTDPGGDPCANGDSIAGKSLAYWEAGMNSLIPVTHQEGLLVAVSAELISMYSCTGSPLTLTKYPNNPVPALTSALCGKDPKLYPAGTGGDRFAPSFKDIDWSNALKIDPKTHQVIP